MVCWETFGRFLTLPVMASRSGVRLSALFLLLATLGSPVPAQWLKLKTSGIARNADGTPNLTAPLARTADGKPDISGIWHRDTDKYYNNIAADLKPGDVMAWADAIYQKRKLGFGKDGPATLCRPQGPASSINPFLDSRIVQTPMLISVLSEDQSHREIFLEGRELEKAPNPAWNGYSTGHWDGDTLVVESNGYSDKTWLDGDGHPHTEDLRMRERFSRVDLGHMNLEVTFTDAKVFPRPVVIKLALVLVVDTEMLEYVCENEKDSAHMSAAKESEVVKVAPEVLASYVGTYEVISNGKAFPVEFTLADGMLYYEWMHEGKQAMIPFGEKLFSLAGTWVEFVTDGKSPASAVHLRSVEGEDSGPRRK